MYLPFYTALVQRGFGFPLTLKCSWFCSRGVHGAGGAARPVQTAAILPCLRWLGWLLAPLGVPWSQAASPWLAGVPEEPTESVLQGPVTSQGGRVAPSQVLRRGGSNVGEVPAAKSSVISEQSKHTKHPCSSQNSEVEATF